METLSNYMTTLVTSVIFITLIEMILPSSKNKKYIKLVSGLILIIVVIKPLVNLLNCDIDINNLLKEHEIEFTNVNIDKVTNYDNDIYDSFRKNLKLDMINRIEENGYKVSNLEIEIDENTYEPKSLKMNIKHQDGEIQPVIIDVFNSLNEDITEYEKETIKGIINANYGIKKNKIKINE